MTDLNDTSDRKIVTFMLDGQIFGIDMRKLVEIREWSEPTPLPGVPSYILGVTNLRGTVVPVIGLSQRLGWKPSEIHSRSCLLIVNLSGKQAGFLVDEVEDIVHIRAEDIQPAPDTEIADPNIISGLVKVNSRAAAGDVQPASDDGKMVMILELEAMGLLRQLEVA